MPDGLIVVLHADQKPPLEISLADVEDGFSDGLGTVQVEVPEGGNGASVGEGQRFRSVEGARVLDETTGQGGVHIPRLRPRLSLRVADEAPAKYQALPIARVRDNGGEFIQEDYVPPCSVVEPGSLLEKRCRSLASEVRRKAVYVAKKAALAANDGDSDGAGSSLLENRQKALALNAGLLQLEAVIRADCFHPHELYLALCHVAGHVTVLRNSMEPPDPPRAYDHKELLATFAPVENFIMEALQSGVHERYLDRRFVRDKDVFSIRVHDEWLRSPLLVEARPSRNVGREALLSWLKDSLIGTESSIVRLQQNRIPGAGREEYESADLIPAPGAVLMRIDLDARYIKAEEELRILNPDAKGAEPAEMILYVEIQASKVKV